MALINCLPHSFIAVTCALTWSTHTTAHKSRGKTTRARMLDIWLLLFQAHHSCSLILSVILPLSRLLIRRSHPPYIRFNPPLTSLMQSVFPPPSNQPLAHPSHTHTHTKLVVLAVISTITIFSHLNKSYEHEPFTTRPAITLAMVQPPLSTPPITHDCTDLHYSAWLIKGCKVIPPRIKQMFLLFTTLWWPVCLWLYSSLGHTTGNKSMLTVHHAVITALLMVRCDISARSLTAEDMKLC